MAHPPAWDLTTSFPAFDGPEYRSHLQALETSLAQLADMAEALRPVDSSNLGDWVAFWQKDEEVLAEYSHMSAYLGSLTAADSSNEAYKQAQAGFARYGAAFKKVFAPVMDALRQTPAAMVDALTQDAALEGAAHFIRRMAEDAHRTMPPELERLAADLAVDGISAWGRLYNDVSGRLEFTMPGPGKPGGRGDGEQGVLVPMAQKRSFLEDPDAAIRKAALVNSNAAWEEVAHVVAASLNAIAGTRLTLNRYRGIDSIMDVALFDSGIEGRTLDAMWASVEGHVDWPWQWLRLKAECLGKERLGFQDLIAPIPQAEQVSYDWDAGVATMLAAFDAAYPALGDFCRTMLAERQVEAEQRKGKRPGAFCVTSLKDRRSRVFMTFTGRQGDLQTLAHELGHAYHGFLLRTSRPLASMYPMTLAETASTFAERLLQDAILEASETSPGQKLSILASRCDDAATFLCDIRMRYLFERAFYAEREQGDVPVSRLTELVLNAQEAAYGDTLDHAELDPLFWASKLHFYITGVSFYNFPYTFGYLLSQVLSARGKNQGPAFTKGYEAFLKATGSGTAEEVVRGSLGEDIGQRAFWDDAMAGITQDVTTVQALLKS